MSSPQAVNSLSDAKLDQLCINTIRTLSIDAVQQAKSGHPGTPMALAPLVYTLWNRVMRFDPQDPIWPNRDRFVLSNGHASMLLWSALHLTRTCAVNAEYERLGEPSVTLDDIQRFRQLDVPDDRWVHRGGAVFVASAQIRGLSPKGTSCSILRHKAQPRLSSGTTAEVGGTNGTGRFGARRPILLRFQTH